MSKLNTYNSHPGKEHKVEEKSKPFEMEDDVPWELYNPSPSHNTEQ